MKKMKSILSLIAAVLLLSSCNSFLDKLPDDRTELNSVQKINDILVSAYGTRDNCFIHKYMSDNVMYNGSSYTAAENEEKLWRFEDVTTEGNDDPRDVWSDYYNAVATANTILEAIDKLGNHNGELNGQKAEALLCRAFAMWRLADIFCMAYDPTKNYPGLPYPTEVGKEYFDRGTLTELYDKINADIENALAIYDDSHIPTAGSKYRFNRKAAYAFAARFNLLYHKWDKCIEYCNEVLGENPFSVLRDWSQYATLGAADTGNLFADSGDPANLFMHTAYSLAGRRLYAQSRYNHSTTCASYETTWAYSPWGNGSGTGNALWIANKMWGTNQGCSCYRIKEFFEYTDKVGGIGYAHIVMNEFSGDEVVLTRAEAYIMKRDFASAVQDMNYWMQANGDQSRSAFPVFTVESVPETMKGFAESVVNPGSLNRLRTIKKSLHPQGFEIDSVQLPYLQLVLHMRRIEQLYTGRRMTDIKRWGIEYTHPTPDNPRPEDDDKEVFRAGDLRGAVQIPNDVIQAGIEPNPRN